MIWNLSLPTLDLSYGFFRSWWSDPLIATVSFGVAINVYWRQERCQGLASYHPWPTSPVLHSLAAYWIGIYLWKIYVPAAGPNIEDGIPDGILSFLYLCAEVVSGIICYDASMFFVHWAMHDVPILRPYHTTHHSLPPGTLLGARDVLRHSFVDGSIQVLLNIMVQRHTLWGSVKTRLGRALHNILVTWMLTESHTSSSKPHVFRRWLVGVREHRLHHCSVNDGGVMGGSQTSTYGVHHRHQQFFGYLDDLRAWCVESRSGARRLKVERVE